MNGRVVREPFPVSSITIYSSAANTKPPSSPIQRTVIISRCMTSPFKFSEPPVRRLCPAAIGTANPCFNELSCDIAPIRTNPGKGHESTLYAPHTTSSICLASFNNLCVNACTCRASSFSRSHLPRISGVSTPADRIGILLPNRGGDAGNVKVQVSPS